MVDVVSIATTVASIITSVVGLAYWLGRKFTEIEFRFNTIDRRFVELEDRFNARFNSIEDGLGRLENRVGKLEDKVSKLEERVGKLENGVSRLEDRINKLEERVSKVEDRINNLENRINNLESRIGSLESSLENRISSLESRISNVENKIGNVGDRLNSIDGRLTRLENAFVQFSDVLLTTFENKNILTPTEALSLKGLVRALMPIPRTKYYTWEVYEKLKQLLDKDPNDYTMADIEELFQIADLIEKEGMETNRRELLEYAWKLRYYAMVARAVFIYPKLRQPQK